MPLLKLPRPGTVFVPLPLPRLGITTAPPSASPPYKQDRAGRHCKHPGVIYCHPHNILFGAVKLQT